MNYKGRCHCGRITYEVEVEPGPAMECNCSICSRRGYLLWFTPREKLWITTGEGSLATYTFSRHVIKHHFCPNCGCALFGIGKQPGDSSETAAINLRCLEGVDLAVVPHQSFDGRGL